MRRNWYREKKTKDSQNHMSTPQDLTDIQGNSPKPNSNFPLVTSDLDLPIAKCEGEKKSQPSHVKFCVRETCPLYVTFLSQLSKMEIPRNVQDALNVPKWKEAILEEMITPEGNETKETVELPRGNKIVGCKWVFTIKFKSNRSLERYKACLVAKGFSQTHGLTILRNLLQLPS